MSRPSARALSAALRTKSTAKPSKRARTKARILATVDHLKSAKVLLGFALEGAEIATEARSAFASICAALKGCPDESRYFRTNDPTWIYDWQEDVVDWFQNYEPEKRSEP